MRVDDGHGGTDTASVTVTVTEAPSGGVGHIQLPGLAGTRLQTSDTAALDITGDIDLRADVALDNWATSNAKLVSKFPGAYELMLNGTTRQLRVGFARAVGGAQTVNSTVALPVADGDRLQVRATIDIDAAAKNTKVTFWYRTDVTVNLTNSDRLDPAWSGRHQEWLGRHRQRGQPPLAGRRTRWGRSVGR